MTFGKEPLIPLEGEELNNFMNAFGYAWDMGWSAKKIADELGFGEKGTWTEKLNPTQVYYIAQKYREEWGLWPRRKLKKKEEEQKTKPVYGVPREPDMPPQVAHYLTTKGWLLE